MFEGKELCVINGPPGTSKEDLERKIAEVNTHKSNNAQSQLMHVHVHLIATILNRISFTVVLDRSAI